MHHLWHRRKCIVVVLTRGPLVAGQPDTWWMLLGFLPLRFPSLGLGPEDVLYSVL